MTTPRTTGGGPDRGRREEGHGQTPNPPARAAPRPLSQSALRLTSHDATRQPASPAGQRRRQTRHRGADVG